MIVSLILHYFLLGLWIYTGYKTISHRKVLPLNLFGLVLIINIIMVYIITTDITIEEYALLQNKARIEWFIFDTLVAILILKVINIARKINKTLKCFTYKSKDVPND